MLTFCVTKDFLHVVFLKVHLDIFYTFCMDEICFTTFLIKFRKLFLMLYLNFLELSLKKTSFRICIGEESGGLDWIPENQRFLP